MKLSASGLPTGATFSDTGDGTSGCVHLTGNKTPNFTAASVTAGTTGGSFTISATEYSNSGCTSSTGISATATPTMNVTPFGSASQLVFTTQPVGNVSEGASFTTSPTVSVEDAYGNLVTSDTGNVTLAINSGPSAGSLSCSNSGFPTIAAVAGVATFTNCQITGTAAAGTYTLVGTRTGLTSTGASSNVVINVGSANKLVFGQQPVGGVGEATNFGTSPTVSVEDAYGNLVTSDTGNVTLAINSGPSAGSLSCSNSGFPTIAAVAGVATFTNCQITGTAAAGTYTLVGTRTGLTSTGASSNVVINVGSANKLVFGQQPVGGVGEATNFGTSPTVSVEDAYGNAVTSDTGNVTLAINSGPSAGSLSCSNSGFPTIAAVAGVATFTNCQITGTAAAGTYTLVGTRTGLTSTGASSNVVINVGSANKLVFGQQPSNAYVGVSMSPAVTVLIEDQYGNLTSSTSSIALTFTTNPCGGSPVVTNGTVSAVSGTATFSSLQISKECIGYALTATDATDGGIHVLSSTFTVSALVTNSANVLQDAATDAAAPG